MSPENSRILTATHLTDAALFRGEVGGWMSRSESVQVCEWWNDVADVTHWTMDI